METTSHHDLLSLTAFFSALLHAIIILGVSFKLPDIAIRPNTDNTLDVVLLNTTNNVTPNEADIISSNDNEGGGSDNQEATSPIPWEIVNPSPIQSIKKEAKQETTKQLSPNQLITVQTGEVSIPKTSITETNLENKNKQDGKDIVTTKSLRQLEKERLIAKIRQTQEDYNKRPKKAFLSPTTKSHGAARYLDEWSKRVVAMGNANFPVQIKARQLTGTLTVSTSINPNGTINSVEILIPSPHKILNDTALRFVRNASPFQAFPDNDYFKSKDIVVITRAFHFLPGNRLTSTAAPSN